MIESLAASPVVHAIGLALIEFLWQGAAIGAVGTLLLFALRRAPAAARYLVACAALTGMAAAPVVTAAAHLSDPAFAGRVYGAVVASDADTSAEAATGPAAGTGAGLAGRGRAADANAVSDSSKYGRLPLVVLLWSIGVLTLTTHLLRGWLAVTRLRQAASDLASGPWPSILASLSERLGVRRHVRLIESACASVPFVVGCLRPVIVVPASALAGLPPAHLEAILTHELIHIRRGDYLVNVVQCVVEILLFYHPAVWWISRQIRIEREHSCDDIVVAASIDRREYAQALASLELLRNRPTLAMAADGGDLLVRVRRLMAPGSSSTPRISGGLAMCTVLTILMLALGGSLNGMPTVVDQGPAGDRAADPAKTSPEPPQEIRTIVFAPSAELTPTAVSTAVTPTVAAPAQPRTPPRPVPVRPAGPATEAVEQGAVTPARATLSGVVVDAQGGVIPGATVTLSRTGGGSRTVPTTAAGEFRMGDLAPGDYQLTVSYVGFKSYREPLVSIASPGVALRIQLEVGSVAEMINVRRVGAVTGLRPSAVEVDAARPLAVQRGVTVDPVMPAPASRVIQYVPEPSAATSPRQVRPIRVGGAVKPPQKIRDVRPSYPAEATGTSGQSIVVIEATIGTDGAVKNTKLLRSVPAFDQSALAAVSQWVYTPGLLGGVPVEVTMTVSVVFEP